VAAKDRIQDLTVELKSRERRVAPLAAQVGRVDAPATCRVENTQVSTCACFEPPTDCEKPGLTAPILEYEHDQSCSVTGGFRYRGSRIPRLYGSYVYGDFCSGQVWTLSADGAPGTPVEITAQTGVRNGLRSFGRDLNGEIYVIGGGAIFRLAPASASG